MRYSYQGKLFLVLVVATSAIIFYLLHGILLFFDMTVSNNGSIPQQEQKKKFSKTLIDYKGYIRSDCNWKRLQSKTTATGSDCNQNWKQLQSESDEALFHPANLDDMWVLINKRIMVRRLGYHDTRIATYPAVVYIVMYDDIPDLPNFKKLFTQLTFKNSSLCLPLEYWGSSGSHFRARKNWKEIHYTYIMRTTNSVHEVPLYGQISTNNNCSSLTDIIPIKSNKTDKVFTYGVCLHKSLFNLTEPETLLHWVELNLALGAEIITIYLQNGYISESYYTLMIPYIKRGVVEVLDWGLRPPLIPGYTKDWGQTSLINECIYRNMYRVKYLGLFDLDEFIVPQKVKTIPEMMYMIEKAHKDQLKAASFIVKHCYYYKRSSQLPEVKQSQALSHCPGIKLPRYYTFTLKSYRELSKYFNKMIVRPKFVISAWIHWLKKSMDGCNISYKILLEDALLHHYRVPEKFHPLKTSSVTSMIMSRYFNDTVGGIVQYTCRRK